jgi:FSR family fosmidomycin resistance protein-like MFS transporter
MYLLIEFLDELVFGISETAWPLLRTDLHLTYTQIGLLFSVPGVITAFIEPFLGILGDVWKRRLLILGGGFFFTLSLVLTAISKSFMPLLISFIIFFPASGAFVSLSQATLMDSAPAWFVRLFRSRLARGIRHACCGFSTLFTRRISPCPT